MSRRRWRVLVAQLGYYAYLAVAFVLVVEVWRPAMGTAVGVMLVVILLGGVGLGLVGARLSPSSGAPELPSTAVASTEVVVRRGRANRTVGWTAVSGRLVLTTSRLVHRVSTMDPASWRVDSWGVAVSDVVEVGVEPRGSWRDIANGGLRRRLRVTTASGHVERFVVTDLDGWLIALRDRTR